ncbi:hypothetical protein DFH06DRAFT_1130114 [Mycena polygramma]|nr:hypothetical protein DFH06DRAFT_1130114 [Mycena polygramma]
MVPAGDAMELFTRVLYSEPISHALFGAPTPTAFIAPPQLERDGFPSNTAAQRASNPQPQDVWCTWARIPGTRTTHRSNRSRSFLAPRDVFAPGCVTHGLVNFWTNGTLARTLCAATEWIYRELNGAPTQHSIIGVTLQKNVHHKCSIEKNGHFAGADRRIREPFDSQEWILSAVEMFNFADRTFWKPYTYLEVIGSIRPGSFKQKKLGRTVKRFNRSFKASRT